MPAKFLPAFARPLCATAMLALAGCGPGDGLPDRLPVSGTVSYNGQPLAKGTISFVPEDLEAGRGASGTIEDGEYRMTTLSPNDGVIPGRYKVAIAAVEDADLSEAMAQAGAGVMDQVSVAQAQKKAESLIPERYKDPSQSGLSAEVARGSTSFDFDLTN